jgi:DNA helicase-2/ATP-dependent DNA helicase PcrA
MFDLDTLNDPQREAVLHDRGPLLILAGAGSGKTRVITHRIAYLIEERGVSPYSILAITFTNKAAKEMKERVGGLLDSLADSIWISTFHSTCVRILRRYIDHIGYDNNFSIYDTDDSKSLIKQVCKDLSIDTKQIKERVFMNKISSLKNECISAEDFERTAYDYTDKQVAKVYKLYQQRLKENNALDFDDLLCKTVELFTVCGEALDYYQNRFEYIMVDEYQDTNNAQFRIIEQLASHTYEDGHTEHNLCVVGDDDQSIYKFRGADITNILSFENKYKNTRVITLDQNYRSTGNILEVANTVIRNNEGRKAKKLWTAEGAGENVCFIQYNYDADEARGIVEDIIEKINFDLSGNTTYRDFAILYRTNAQSRSLEEKLVAKNVPYRIVGGVNFYQRKEIKDILAYLKTIDNGQDALQTKRIINIPKRGIGTTTIEHVQSYADAREISFYDALLEAVMIPEVARARNKLMEFTEVIETLKESAGSKKISELIDDILEATNYNSYLEEFDEEDFEDRQNNVQALRDKAVEYENEAGEEATLSDFLSEVALVADIDGVAENENCVLLMTLHSAKGLEFNNVYICGMEEGLFPSSLSMEDPTELEEERRLCYVGITRAKKTLTLTAAKQRMMYGELKWNPVSRFILKEIPREMLTVKGHAHESYMRAKTKEDREKQNSNFSTGSFNPYSYGRQSVTSTAPQKDYYKVKTVTPPTVSNLPYNVGDKVKHIRFGIGTVTDITKGSKDYEVSVDFNGTSKKMLASFAKLKKI